MKSPSTPCPRCETPASFRPRQRAIGDNSIEVFIRCPVCGWRKVLYHSNPEIEALKRSERRWSAYGRATIAKHGVASSLATAQLRRVRERLQELENEYAQR